MENEEATAIFSYTEYIDYIKHVVSVYERGNENKYSDIHKDLSVVENRLRDDDLYLGVVGAFSSGKSTFINSVIRRNLLPTDAVQGTTVAASILKKAEFEDLEIQYIDGAKKRFSESKDEMCEKYGIQTIEPNEVAQKQSFLRKLLNWIKRLFGIGTEINNGQTKEPTDPKIELFKKIIATEELASDLKSVTLYYKNDNIPYRIALVDTPGTESLNSRHNDVTKSAIDDICDAIVVIIPYDEPVSEELIAYINNNIDKNKEDCIYVVTKVELLGDQDELPRLIRVIKKRLENGLSIDDAIVIPMPTLIYLKSVDAEMHMTFLDDVPEEEKHELIKMYESGIAEIKSILEQNRNNYIRKKIIDICERVNGSLESNLSDVVNDYEREKKELIERSVPPLKEFEDLARRTIGDYGDINKKRIAGETILVTVGFSNIRDKVDDILNGCTDSQDIINGLSLDCTGAFSYAQNMMDTHIKNINSGFNQKIEELNRSFRSKYQKCGINQNAQRVNISSSGFFTESITNECNELLQSAISSIKATIKNDTSGFLKKIKSFFSNPYTKHREMASTKLYEVVDQITQKVDSYIRRRLSTKIDDASAYSSRNIGKMINDNRAIIEEYIYKTNQSISANDIGKAETMEYINKLKQYIRIMEEG